MNIAIYSTVLMAILIGMAGLVVVTRFRTIRAAELARTARLVDANRYKPMLRLLSARDLELVAADKELTKLLRAQRHKAFRAYLRCLTKDFGALLGGVRLMIVESSVDRPDLAALLYRSEWNFTKSLCRIELLLCCYRFGVGTPDIGALVDQLQSLGAQMQTPAFSASAA